MEPDELKSEIGFGLENLEKIYQSISSFAQQDADDRLKLSALTYEGLGYYNAVEHLIIRLLKYLGREIPSGAFSHRDTVKAFRALAIDKGIGEDVIRVIEDLMAFRHIATKIYGFLIDWNKLKVILDNIEKNHEKIKDAFAQIVDTIQP